MTIVNEKSSANNPQQVLTPPAPPKTKKITITLGSFDTLSGLAAKYHTDINSIMAANGIKDANKIREGQTIIIDAIPEDVYVQYQKAVDEYETLLYEQKRAEEIAQRTAKSEAFMEQAMENGWGEDYTFSIDKNNGYTRVTLKDGKNLGEIKRDFNLPAGSLSETNSLESKYNIGTARTHDDRIIENWDVVEAAKGDSFLIDPNVAKTKRTWTQFFKDIWPF